MDTVITNIAQLITPVDVTAGASLNDGPLHVVHNAELCIHRGRIVSEIEDRSAQSCRTIDARGGVLLPGLIDPCWKAATPPAWLEAKDPLQDGSVQWLERMLTLASWNGMTAVELKWPHGNDGRETAQLSELTRRSHARLTGTVLVSLPDETPLRHAQVSRLIGEVIPEIRQHRSARFLEICWDEHVDFLSEGRAVLRAACGAGLRPKLFLSAPTPADGLAEFATSLNISTVGCACHVPAEVGQLLWEAGVIPLYLPLFFDGRSMKRAPCPEQSGGGVLVALGSGNGVGSAAPRSMWSVMAAGIERMGLSLDEAIAACTLGNAAALEMTHDLGTLDVGKCADLILLGVDDYRALETLTGFPPISWVMIGGEMVRVP
jgi:imidazolonepropionase